MASKSESVITEELSKALVFDHSSLLVFSSNCSTQEVSERPKCDEDAERIKSAMVTSGIIKDSNAALITTSGCCNKSTLQEAIGDQISKIETSPNGERLFIFVYCGGACDLRSFDSSVTVSEPSPADEEGFIAVDFVPMQCTHSLVLNDFDPANGATHVSGQTIANAISKSPSSPKQLLIILDCPHAGEIGEEIESHLNSCDLDLIVSQGKGVVSHFISPLESSTFSYFLCSFLSQLTCTNGVIRLRPLFSKVAECCDALSCLRMVRVGQSFKPVGTAPKGRRFEKIIESAEADHEMKREDDGEDVDYTGTLTVSRFLELFYKKYWLNLHQVRLCNKAKDWVYAMMEGPLLLLARKHKMLQKREVLEAIVSSMMFSIAVIQSHEPSAKSSNIFLQAYVYVIAAVDMLDPNLNLFDTALLSCAQEFYCGALQASNIDDKEIKQLKWTKIEQAK